MNIMHSLTWSTWSNVIDGHVGAPMDARRRAPANDTDKKPHFFDFFLPFLSTDPTHTPNPSSSAAIEFRRVIDGDRAPAETFSSSSPLLFFFSSPFFFFASSLLLLLSILFLRQIAPVVGPATIILLLLFFFFFAFSGGGSDLKDEQNCQIEIGIGKLSWNQHNSQLLASAMAKKGSTIKAAPMKEEEPVSEQEKIKPKRKKLGQEIDEIFSNKKLKKAEEQQMEKATEDGIEKPKKKKKKNKDPKKDGFVDPPPRERKRTEDGFAIYTEEELGIVKSDAGGTPLCPFDCSCCF